MRLPILSPPVKRPDIIYPHRAVDVIHGRVEDLVSIRMDLLHGANYNDPAAFQTEAISNLSLLLGVVVAEEYAGKTNPFSYKRSYGVHTSWIYPA